MALNLPPIICFSTEDWDTPLPTNKRQLMQRLASPELPVVWIDTVGTRLPRLTMADARRVWRRLGAGAHGINVPPGLHRVSPRVIPGGPRRLNNMLLQGSLKRAIREAGINDFILWVYNPYAIDYWKALSRQPLLTVYHCVDDLSGVPGARGSAIREAEERLLERADLVFCTSKALLDRCQVFNHRCVYTPNVADFDHFHKSAGMDATIPEVMKTIPQPRIVFAGNLVDYKVDFGLIGEAARRRPEWHFVLIGPEWPGNPRDALKDLKALRNVHFTGLAAYEALPDYLAAAEVLIMPYRTGPQTETIFPLKFFEFLATGKPVVSTAITALRGRSGPAPLVNGPKEFVEAIAWALDGAQDCFREERLDLARANTWDARLAGMAALIRKALEQRPSP